jgi:hypothetical protein
MIDYSGLAANLASVLTPGTTGGGLFGIGGPQGIGFSARNVVGQTVTAAQRPSMSQVFMAQKQQAEQQQQQQDTQDAYRLKMAQIGYQQRLEQANSGRSKFQLPDIMSGLPDLEGLKRHRRAKQLMPLSEYRQRLALQSEQFGQDGQALLNPFTLS